MKVLLVNGSPHKDRCVYTALCEVKASLEENGIQGEIFHIGNGSVRGCIDCGKCKDTGRCIFQDDICNELHQKMSDADGIVIGSPVYYAAPNGALCALLDRVFFSDSGTFAGKPAAAVVSCRRGGASAAFDRLNKYFTISRMPVVSSQYWNSVHGFTADDVRKDLEGLQIMRTLGRNMAWLLKSRQKAGLPIPDPEPWQPTNFIR